MCFFFIIFSNVFSLAESESEVYLCRSAPETLGNPEKLDIAKYNLHQLSWQAWGNGILGEEEQDRKIGPKENFANPENLHSPRKKHLKNHNTKSVKRYVMGFELQVFYESAESNHHIHFS